MRKLVLFHALSSKKKMIYNSIGEVLVNEFLRPLSPPVGSTIVQVSHPCSKFQKFQRIDPEVAAYIRSRKTKIDEIREIVQSNMIYVMDVGYNTYGYAEKHGDRVYAINGIPVIFVPNIAQVISYRSNWERLKEELLLIPED
jgi:hypothetical protein